MGNKQQITDFLWFSYFGITPNCNDDIKIQKCIERAYRDLNRTIDFTYSQSVLDKKSDQTISQGARDYFIKAKQDFKSELIQYIKQKVKELPEELKKRSFREWHNEICNEIIKCNPDVEGLPNVKVLKENLSYGQAQKWVNMTLKYMWLMGLIEEPVIQKQLCVPVDNYILKALYDEQYNVDPFVIVKDGDTYKVKQKNGNTAYSWSQFPDACFYYGLDDKIKAIIGEKMPLDWENEVWCGLMRPNQTDRKNPKMRRL